MGRDGIAGLVLLAASLVLFAATLGLERHPMVPVGPAFYPRLVLGITAALAVVLVVLDLVAHRRRRAAPGQATAAASPAQPRPNYPLVALCFGIFTLYAVSLPWLGFRLATFLFLFAMQVALEPPKGVRRWVVIAVAAVLATVATYVVFETYLQVLLPRGRWTGI